MKGFASILYHYYYLMEHNKYMNGVTGTYILQYPNQSEERKKRGNKLFEGYAPDGEEREGK